MAAAETGDPVSLSLVASHDSTHTNKLRSDAEPAVLAEYVAELFSAAGSAAEIKSSCVEQLSDFLESGAFLPHCALL